LKFKAGEPDEASDAKRACTDNEDNKWVLYSISAFPQTNLIIELKLTIYLFSKKLGTDHLTSRGGRVFSKKIL
jgi:hypothetical protein